MIDSSARIRISDWKSFDAVGEDRQDDPQEAVGGHLREHAGEDRQRRQRHRPVRVRHPPVEREERHLDQEREREGGEDPALRRRPEVRLREVRDREGDRAAVGRQHRRRHRAGQHQQRADQRVDDHLVGRRHPVRPAAPLADEEVERDQHQVEEEDEERQVLRGEGAQHRGLRQREVEREQPRPLDRAERQPHRRHQEQQRRQRDQPQVEPVDAEVVADAERLDPLVVGDVLEPAGRRVVVEQHHHRVGERHDRADDRGPRRPAARPGRAQQRERQRPEQQHRQVDGQVVHVPATRK